MISNEELFAAGIRQKWVDEGCRIKVTCSPRERKWRVMVWTDYQTQKDDPNMSHFKSWKGTGPFTGVGKTEAEATMNLMEQLNGDS